jgi:hypothetical protein
MSLSRTYPEVHNSWKYTPLLSELQRLDTTYTTAHRHNILDTKLFATRYMLMPRVAQPPCSSYSLLPIRNPKKDHILYLGVGADL